MAQHNPLSGISIPSVEELIDRAIGHLGKNGIIHLDNASHRLRLRNALIETVGHELRWHYGKAFQQACERAIDHIVRLSVDPKYQEKRAAQRTASRESRKAMKDQRNRDRAIQLEIQREVERQKRAGFLQ